MTVYSDSITLAQTRNICGLEEHKQNPSRFSNNTDRIILRSRSRHRAVAQSDLDIFDIETMEWHC